MANKPPTNKKSASSRGNSIITQAAYQAGISKAIKSSAKIFSTVVAYTLWNTSQYDKDELREIMNRIHNSFDVLNDGYADITELSAILEEEADFIVE